MKMYCRSLALAVALVSLVAEARAAIVYDTDSSTISIPLGQSNVVNVYLHETGTTVINSGGGLFGTGFGVARDATTHASLSNPTLSGSFDIVTTTNTAALAGESGNRFSSSATSGPTTGGDGRVLLGTVTITGDSLGTSIFTLQDFNAATSDNLTYAFDDLDSSIGSGTLTVNVTAVPEPATAAVGLFAFAGFALRRRRAANVR